MKRRMLCSATVITLGLLAGPCTASTVIDTYPDWEGQIVSGWQKIAQSFIVPAGDNILDNYTFGIALETTKPTFRFEIFNWDETVGPVGSALYSIEVDWPDSIGDVVIENIGLALPEGGLYAVIIDCGEGFSGKSLHWQTNQNSYSHGDLSLWNPSIWQHLDSGWNSKFRAEFVAPCKADVNGDGIVNIDDLFEVLANWGVCQ